MRSPKIFITMFLSIVLVMGLLACTKGASNVDAVRNGILELDKSITVGQAFDNYKYFSQTSWKGFQTDNGRNVVEVSGVVNMDKHPQGQDWKEQGVKHMEVIFQFLLHQDKENFEIHTYGVKMRNTEGDEVTIDASEMGLTDYEMLNNLQEIYDNVPFS